MKALTLTDHQDRRRHYPQPGKGERLAMLIATMPSWRVRPRTIRLAVLNADAVLVPTAVKRRRPRTIHLRVLRPRRRRPRRIRLVVIQPRRIRLRVLRRRKPRRVRLRVFRSKRCNHRIRRPRKPRPPKVRGRVWARRWTVPRRPTAEFPLKAHPRGQWMRRVGGKNRYYGRWRDPAAGRLYGTLDEVDPNGRMWRAALARFEIQTLAAAG